MSATRFPRNPILIVDDEYYILLNLKHMLKSHGIDNVVTCQDSRKAMDVFAEQQIDVLLLDLTMPHVSGREILVRVREEHPDVPVIVITGANEVSVAVECMKLGVFDYLVKSVEESKLLAAVGRAIEIKELRRENLSLRDHLVGQSLEHPEDLEGIIYRDPKMAAVLMYAESIARGSQTVLITGETGVGKELAARAVHSLSGRKGEFVAINVAALDDTMFSDTLFGHLKGAYTGAATDRKGLVAAAAGGTLFLDEIGDLSPKTQISLLRLLERREYYPLGSDLTRRTDARVIVATNQDLRKAIHEGRFRRDLYFRLQTHHLHVPPLRERPADLPVLAESFLREACAEYGKQFSGVPKALLSVLSSYTFPGNVRELRSMVFDAVSREKGPEVSPEMIRELVGSHASLPPPGQEEALLEIGDEFPTLRQADGFLVAEALRRSGGNQARAAKLLGISPPALSRRLKKPGP